MKKMIKIYLSDKYEYVLSQHKNGRYYFGIRDIKTNETSVIEIDAEDFYNRMEDFYILGLKEVVDERGKEE